MQAANSEVQPFLPSFEHIRVAPAGVKEWTDRASWQRFSDNNGPGPARVGEQWNVKRDESVEAPRRTWRMCSAVL